MIRLYWSSNELGVLNFTDKRKEKNNQNQRSYQGILAYWSSQGFGILKRKKQPKPKVLPGHFSLLVVARFWYFKMYW